MGAILAKFRKEKTTTELLEKLEQDIKQIEEYSISTQATQKRYVGNFLVVSIGFYVICFIVFYFAFFPPTWMERITYSVPLLIFPLLIFLLKRLVAWYFQRKINKNSLKFNQLNNEKKKVLEKVMEKETYKVALEILNRFGDKSSLIKTTGVVTPRVSNIPALKVVPSSIIKSEKSQTITHRTNTTPNQLIGDSSSNSQVIPFSTPKTKPDLKYNRTPNSNAMQNLQIQRKSTPFPIINPQNRGVLEKMVDYLIGDGPQNRFAMICKECFGHNGMALEEEYQYAPFSCIYCNTMNPSRKSRPIAPKLPRPNYAAGGNSNNLKKKIRDSDSSTSTSEKFSDSDDSANDVKISHTQLSDTEMKKVETVAEQEIQLNSNTDKKKNE